MATVLDNVLERHEGPEPRVLVEDVQAVLRLKIRPGAEDVGESVALLAHKACVSTRTVYRVLNPDDAQESINLGLADRLCLAADAHIALCRLHWPDGTVTPYTETAQPGVM